MAPPNDDRPAKRPVQKKAASKTAVRRPNSATRSEASGSSTPSANATNQSSSQKKSGKKQESGGRHDPPPRFFNFCPFSIPEGDALKFYLDVIHCLCEEQFDEPLFYTLDQIEALESRISIIDFAIASHKVAAKRYISHCSQTQLSTHEEVVRELHVANRSVSLASRQLLISMIPADLVERFSVVLEIAGREENEVQMQDEVAVEPPQPTMAQVVKSGPFDSTNNKIKGLRKVRSYLKVKEDQRACARSESQDRVVRRNKLERAGLLKSTPLDAKLVMAGVAPCVRELRIIDLDQELVANECKRLGISELAFPEEADNWMYVPAAIHIHSGTENSVIAYLKTLTTRYGWNVTRVTSAGDSEVTAAFMSS